MEDHHNVRILDEAIVDCVKLSHRYITGRQLPDKIVSVLDTACAKVAIGQGATPASIEDATRRIQNLTSEIDALEREQVTGAEHEERLEELKTKRERNRSGSGEAQRAMGKRKGTDGSDPQHSHQAGNVAARRQAVDKRNGNAAAATATASSRRRRPRRRIRQQTEAGRRCIRQAAAAPAPEAAKPADTEFLKS